MIMKSVAEYSVESYSYNELTHCVYYLKMVFKKSPLSPVESEPGRPRRAADLADSTDTRRRLRRSHRAHLADRADGEQPSESPRQRRSLFAGMVAMSLARSVAFQELAKVASRVVRCRNHPYHRCPTASSR